MSEQSVYVVKVRERGKRAWAFLTPSGGMNHLRIHASQFRGADSARSAVDQLTTDNPTFEFKSVPMK